MAFRAQMLSAFVFARSVFWEKVTKGFIINPRTVNHCWKAKACVLGHYTENCLTEKTLHLRALSRNYLLETAPDWSTRQCYFPRTHSYVNDLWTALRLWRTNQSTAWIILFLAKGKSLSKRLKNAQNALAQDKLIQFTSCCCWRKEAFVALCS